MSNQFPLQVESISFSYTKKLILDDVSFNVLPGCFTVLLGVNGAGKTTLFSLITRLYSPDVGRIMVYGHNLNKSPDKALTKIGVVFQSPTLDMDLTIKQNIFYHAALYGISKDEAKIFLKQNLTRYLPDCHENQKIHQLSGGQKRSVELIRALIHKPQLLLLDEPTVGLDIKNRARYILYVRDLCQSMNIGVLWATHLADEVNHSDNIIVLHQSKVVANSLVERLLLDCKVNNISDAFTKIITENSNQKSSTAREDLQKANEN